jgi:hypothetical protein
MKTFYFGKLPLGDGLIQGQPAQEPRAMFGPQELLEWPTKTI